jgi:putative ABC transport system substrate-binding protein
VQERASAAGQRLTGALSTTEEGATMATRPEFLRRGAAAGLSRRAFVGGLVGLGATVLAGACSNSAVAPSPSPSPRRIGGLFSGFPRVDSGIPIREALAELGYLDGRDYVLEYRYAEGSLDRLPALAAELAQLKVDLIVTSGGDAPVLAAQAATNSIPIVFTGVGDPLGNGLVPDLVRPGGNTTGVAGVDASGKGLELLKSVVPSVRRVAVLYAPALTSTANAYRAAEQSARTLDLQLIPVTFGSLGEVVQNLERAARERPEALWCLLGTSAFGRALEQFGPVLDFVTRERLPQCFGDVLFVRAGALMSTGANTANRWRLMAHLMDKIFRGASPGDLPVIDNAVFDIALNLSMARKIGLTIPEAVMRQVTEVVQ